MPHSYEYLPKFLNSFLPPPSRCVLLIPHFFTQISAIQKTLETFLTSHSPLPSSLATLKMVLEKRNAPPPPPKDTWKHISHIYSDRVSCRYVDHRSEFRRNHRKWVRELFFSGLVSNFKFESKPWRGHGCCLRRCCLSPPVCLISLSFSVCFSSPIAFLTICVICVCSLKIRWCDNSECSVSQCFERN